MAQADPYAGNPHAGLPITDDDATIAAMLEDVSIPTLALFRGGRELARVSGALPAAEIVRWAREHAA